ncbi:uncharacterized protein LOC143891093 [Tasmannia lanceolata]|uniref:uncharacterized protein LOC143891093 n=1 Tax=Tasmannia lanceolata TaxID=3420 RepID=UPI004064B03A
MESMLGDWWNYINVIGQADVIIGMKLRYVKAKLKNWVVESKTSKLARRWWLENYMREVEVDIEVGLAFEADRVDLGGAKEEHKGIVLREEISWKQKSRVKWLIEGDRNSAYFHAMTSARWRSNRISVLNVEGSMINDKEGISCAILDFYGSLYSSEDITRPIPEDVVFKGLSLEERSFLEVPFDEEEVKKAVYSMSRDKAPGPDGFFKSSRGLRQGDPLSPFLFVIVAETLSRLIVSGCALGLFQGFKIARDRVEVSHLQFADDTLLFCCLDEASIANIKGAIRCYEMFSSQKVNFHKLFLFAINMPLALASSFARMLGCKLDSLPSKYLGLPLGVGRPRKHLWDPVVERIDKRLDTWKRNLISKGGRLVLVKAVLASIPTYFFSLFKCPVSVALKIEQIQRRFLWGGSGDSLGVPLVKWEELWRFSIEQDQFWVKVVVSKYGSKSGQWESDDLFSFKGITVWRDILKIRAKFVMGTRLKVYSGDRIRFWLDAWCALEPLCMLFLMLFRVAPAKEVLRNARVFNGVHKPAHRVYINTIASVIARARCLPPFQFVSAFDLWEGWRVICLEGSHCPKVIPRWSPSPLGKLKISFDGSSFGNQGPAGIGGLCRNSSGESVWNFSGPLGVCDSSEAVVERLLRASNILIGVF